MSTHKKMNRVTTANLKQMKRTGEKIACSTAYDASFAKLLDAASCDIVLIGDSLGMVIQGHETTVPVTVDNIIYHTEIVARVCERMLVMADMPFMSYRNPEQALDNATRIMQEGDAHMVKLEGGSTQSDVVRCLSERGIPVCAHLGLQPQFIHKLGGYRVQGKQDEEAERMRQDSLALQAAGADLLLLECVPAALAADITRALKTPVIGIGAGVDCDDQILVIYDILGISPDITPSFCKDFMPDAASISEAIANYIQAVKEGAFPTPQHSF